MQQNPSCEADSLVRQNIPHFLWTENFINVFKEAPTSPYPKPVESSPHFCLLRYSFVCPVHNLFSQLVSSFQLFHPDFSIHSSYTCMYATCPSLVNPLITLIIFCELNVIHPEVLSNSVLKH